jgi:hypothetical protein
LEKEMGVAKDRNPLLVERQETHGSFKDNARISQHIKSVMHGAGYRTLDPVYTECLDMIALKISRILSGRAYVKDHWDDIAGYAHLASELCEK